RPLHLQVGLVVAGSSPVMTIEPNVPLPFDYAPVRDSPAWVRTRAAEVAEEVRQSIIAQAELVERYAEAAGWTPIPPRRSDDYDLRRLARRLYRRAVLEESWAKIADWEREETDAEWCD